MADEMMEFTFLRGGNKANSRTTTVDFRKADLGLYKEYHMKRKSWRKGESRGAV